MIKKKTLPQVYKNKNVINENEETQKNNDKLAYTRRYQHEHEDFQKDKNRKNRERSALRYRNDSEFRKKLLIERYSFKYRNKKLKGSGNILSFIELK